MLPIRRSYVHCSSRLGSLTVSDLVTVSVGPKDKDALGAVVPRRPKLTLLDHCRLLEWLQNGGWRPSSSEILLV